MSNTFTIITKQEFVGVLADLHREIHLRQPLNESRCGDMRRLYHYLSRPKHNKSKLSSLVLLSFEDQHPSMLVLFLQFWYKWAVAHEAADSNMMVRYDAASKYCLSWIAATKTGDNGAKKEKSSSDKRRRTGIHFSRGRTY